MRMLAGVLLLMKSPSPLEDGRIAQNAQSPSLRVPVTSSLILAFTNSANRTVINSTIASTRNCKGVSCC